MKDNILRPTTHPAYLEAAMLRLYSLWPHLVIEQQPPKTATSTTASSTNTTKASDVCFGLQWENRLQGQNAFRDPDSYQPNINLL